MIKIYSYTVNVSKGKQKSFKENLTLYSDRAILMFKHRKAKLYRVRAKDIHLRYSQNDLY